MLLIITHKSVITSYDQCNVNSYRTRTLYGKILIYNLEIIICRYYKRDKIRRQNFYIVLWALLIAPRGLKHLETESSVVRLQSRTITGTIAAVIYPASVFLHISLTPLLFFHFLLFISCFSFPFPPLFCLPLLLSFTLFPTHLLSHFSFLFLSLSNSLSSLRIDLSLPPSPLFV